MWIVSLVDQNSRVLGQAAYDDLDEARKAARKVDEMVMESLCDRFSGHAWSVADWNDTLFYVRHMARPYARTNVRKVKPEAVLTSHLYML